MGHFFEAAAVGAFMCQLWLFNKVVNKSGQGSLHPSRERRAVAQTTMLESIRPTAISYGNIGAARDSKLLYLVLSVGEENEDDCRQGVLH